MHFPALVQSGRVKLSICAQTSSLNKLFHFHYFCILANHNWSARPKRNLLSQKNYTTKSNVIGGYKHTGKLYMYLKLNYRVREWR